MNRKHFIRNLSFIGAGLSLTPWKLVTAKSSVRRFRLPPASIHIPHGNFAVTNLESLYIPEMDIDITVQRFMRNGIESSHQDLTVYNIARGEEAINVGLSNDSPLIVGGITGMQTQLEDTQVSFESNNFRLILTEGEYVVLNRH